jgi:cellulose synthase/poly-beta-1,6-N-acetylglucosamine synthase-like glycosyltransferase
MPSVDILLSFALAFAIALILYAYVGYPIVVWILARCFGRNETPPLLPDDEIVPPVSLLIVAHNEEVEIEKRIQNALNLDYPVGKIEIVVASDGSTDRTNQIVNQFAKYGVRLLAYPMRRGKSAVLNDAFGELKHDIVVLSDANTSFNRESVHHLASWFADPSIGVVCGRLVLTDADTGHNVDGLYWKYETFLKKCESKLGALLGSNGGIYAIRKSLFEGIPDNTIVDDFVIPLLARERTGCRIVYDRNAVACEETSESIGSEFHRRVRIGAGGFQSIGMLRSLLSPVHGWVSFTFWSHKILRWLCPFFMITALVLNLMLLEYPLLRGLLFAQVAFYIGSLLATRLPARPRFLRVFKLGPMFTMMNVALLFGFFRWLRGSQKAAWKRTERTAVADLLPVPQPVEVAE